VTALPESLPTTNRYNRVFPMPQFINNKYVIESQEDYSEEESCSFANKKFI